MHGLNCMHAHVHSNGECGREVKKIVPGKGRMQWVEKNVRSDLRQASYSIPARVHEREGVGTYKVGVRPAMMYIVRVGDSGTGEKTGGGDGGGI